MKFKLFVKTMTTFAEVVLALVTLIMFTAFAIRPAEISLLTNSLILIMVLVQLYTINVLIDVYDKLGMVKRR